MLIKTWFREIRAGKECKCVARISVSKNLRCTHRFIGDFLNAQADQWLALLPGQNSRIQVLRKDFQRFRCYQRYDFAGKFLDNWTTRTIQTNLGPMKKVATMLRKHKPMILNWFKAKGELSSGAVEGMNLKAKLTMRKAYGFKTLKCLGIASYHDLAKLPGPDCQHRFC